MPERIPWDNIDSFKKNSIYLRDDESDRDYEFLVFIDPEDPARRSEFLEEIYQVLIENGSGNPAFFARETHKTKLIEWIGRENTGRLLPLNWIKLVIEQYPYRLFIAIDPAKPREKGGWQNENGQTPLSDTFWYNDTANGRQWHDFKFLYKRICWLDKNQLHNIFYEYSRLQRDPDYAFKNIKTLSGQELTKEIYLKLWLFLQWIIHVSKRMRRIKDEYLMANFYNLHSTSEQESKYPPYFADTLPEKLRAKEPGTRKRVLLINLKKAILRLTDEENQGYSHPTILFRRHTNIFRYYEQKEEWKSEYSGSRHVFYGESLSGGLSYWTTLIDAINNIYTARSIRIFLSLIEQALMRTCLIDERVQHWYGGLTQEMAGFLIQQRLFVGFFNDPSPNNPQKMPDHNLYARVSALDGKIDFRLSDEKYLELITAQHQIDNKLDMLIIHQGILDKWKSNPTELLKAILDWKDSVPFLVITSGRGIPTNLPQGVKFLPYSTVESCINGSYFEKLTLIRQVYSLIREVNL
jgi:hypothetical protein